MCINKKRQSQHRRQPMMRLPVIFCLSRKIFFSRNHFLLMMGESYLLKRFLMLSKRDFLVALSAWKFSHSLNFFTSSFSSLFRVLGI